MKNERLMRLIVGPHTTEKTTMLADQAERKQIGLRVLKDAAKQEIKKAVELMFNVKVEAVNTTNTRSKLRLSGRAPSQKKRHWKKAYVTLRKGDDINFISIQDEKKG